MNEYFATYQESPPVRAVQFFSKEWGRVRFYPDMESVVFDVKKTDSLVSPYQGIIEFEMFEDRSDPKEKREDVTDDLPFTRTGKTYFKHRHVYLYSEGQWKISERTFSPNLFGNKKSFPCTEHEGCY